MTSEANPFEIITDRRTIAETLFRLKGKQFSLENYPPLWAVYALNAPKTVIMSGRQVSKSTTVSTGCVSQAAGVAFWESLTVHPSLAQSRSFSSLRVAPLIKTSPEIQEWMMDKDCINNVSMRTLANGSVMHFGSTSQMESLRGLSANTVNEDEIQDMVSDDLEVIEEVMSGQPSDKQFVMRTGTAKTVGNILESTWRKSTMNEWIVPCPSGHWNIPSPDNIGMKGFICKKCKALCDVRLGRWYATNGEYTTNKKPWVGFRIPQIILPMHTEDAKKWATIVGKKHGDIDPVRFLNEVMGHSAGSGITLLSEDDLRACCRDYEPLDEGYIPQDEHYFAVFATIDWGATARKSFTVLAIWGVTGEGKLKLLFAERYLERDVIKQVDMIAATIQGYGADMIGVDWGAGFAQSRLLEQKLRKNVHRFMYVGEQMELIKWSEKNEVWNVNRTQAMTETFVKMRMQDFHFPYWDGFFEYYASDILAVYEEPLDDRNLNDKIKYDHDEATPDDFCHVCVYALLLFHLATTGGIR